MSATHYYEVSVKWESERKGKLHAPGLHSAIEVVTPPEFPKGIEGFWSPEHLLVAASNSCLMTTFLAIAENSKLSFIDFSSKAIGKLEVIDGKYQISEIELFPEVVLEDAQQKDRALRIIEKAESNCLISNSLKSKIILNPSVKILNSAITI